jgi:hypothetical protein
MRIRRDADHWLPRLIAHVGVAVFRPFLPVRIRYPDWERLSEPTPDLKQTWRRPGLYGNAAERPEHEYFDLMDCDGRYLLQQQINSKLNFFFVAMKLALFAWLFMAVIGYVVDEPDILYTPIYLVPLALFIAIPYGMQLLRIRPIDKCTAFDRYNGTVYFPGGLFSRPLVCNFADVEAWGGTKYSPETYQPTAYLKIKPTVRRPWSLRPCLSISISIDWKFLAPQIWQQIERFMKTPIGTVLPGPDLQRRVAAYHQLGLTIPEVRPPGKSRFAGDGFESEDWWRAVCYELKQRGRPIPQARVPELKRGYDHTPEDGTGAAFLSQAFTNDPFAENFTDAEAAAHGIVTERMAEERERQKSMTARRR